MSGIDRALAGNPFSVDPTQCLLAADKLRGYSPATSSQLWSGTPTSAQIVFKLFFVAICHQVNWDFLQRRMFEQFFAVDFHHMISAATNASSAEIENLLLGYHRPERVRASERAKYLRTTSIGLQSRFNGDPQKLVQAKRVFGEGGLLDLLKQLPAYSEDPLSKKSNAFAQELARERIVEFQDADRIPPAIDYHLIRLYLRNGRVFATDPHIFNALRSGTTHRMRLVRLLREEVSKALELTASYANLAIHELNYLEWQIARNRCERDFTNCDGAWPADLIDPDVSSLGDCCPLKESCNAYAMPQWKAMLEPEIKKAFY